MKIMPFLKEPLPSPARQGEKVVQKTSKHYDSMTLRGSHGALASDAWTSFDRAPFLGSFATTNAAAWSPKAEALPSAWTATATKPYVRISAYKGALCHRVQLWAPASPSAALQSNRSVAARGSF